MEKSEFRKNAADMIYLTSCVFNKKKPKQERIDKLDLPKLFEVCQAHIMTACVAYALESVGIRDHEFTQAKEKAIRKNILLDAERGKILKILESEKIWYMPLKGALLKNWYPGLGMRQMSDNDILCDNTKMKDIRRIFLEQGYTCDSFGEGSHDVYQKKPVLNFEMHRYLINSTHDKKFNEYYSDVKERLVRDKDNDHGYHFTNEDFYIFMLVHEYKHFSEGGTGVRSLADTYIFLNKFNDSLDWEYIYGELEKIGITEFEKNNRELSMKLFSSKPLSADEKKLLNYHVLSGTYGNVANSVNNNIKNNSGNSKMKYIFYRFFPPLEHYRVWFPWAYEHKILLPAAWIFRLVRGVTVRRKRIKAEYIHLTK